MFAWVCVHERACLHVCMLAWVCVHERVCVCVFICCMSVEVCLLVYCSTEILMAS